MRSAVAHAEHRPQDHLERDRLHARPQREGRADRPARPPRPRWPRPSPRRSGARSRRGRAGAAACAGSCGGPRRESAASARRARHPAPGGWPRRRGRRSGRRVKTRLTSPGSRHVDHSPEEREARREHVAVALRRARHPAVRRGRDQRGLDERRQPGARWEAHGRETAMLQVVRTALLSLLLLLVLCPAALAQGTLTEAAGELRDTPVYVDPDAERPLSDQEVAALRDAIREQGAGPLYIAVLPEERGRRGRWRPRSGAARTGLVGGGAGHVRGGVRESAPRGQRRASCPADEAGRLAAQAVDAEQGNGTCGGAH